MPLPTATQYFVLGSRYGGARCARNGLARNELARTDHTAKSRKRYKDNQRLQTPFVLRESKHPRCTVYDPCWPSAEVWQRFNASVAGRLIASRPSAARCHDPDFDAGACNIVSSKWTNSQWRTDQVGGYSGLLWEVGSGQCYPNSTRSSPCGHGLVAAYSLDARSVEAVQAGIRFAGEHNLYVTIKNTGHDHLGRSSGDGSFTIWTHHLRGRTWHEEFTPRHAPSRHPSVPAVTLQAGEQWLDVYRDADAHNVTVVGGSATTVGAAGGYVLGGGHSPWSHFYGLAADNVLEVSLVTPSGQAVVLNAYSDPEYFWAVRGGAGSAWGVITNITYQTHPLPENIQVAYLQVFMNSSTSYRAVYGAALRALPALTDAGYTGYGTTTVRETLQFIFLRPNGTEKTLERGMEGFQQIINLNNTADITLQAGNFTLPSWRAYTDLFLHDPNVATNVQDATRLLTADILSNKADELIDLAFQYPDMSPGHNFIGKVAPSQRDRTSVHPIWKSSRAIISYGVDWDATASEVEKKRKKQNLVQVSRALEKIVGQDGGTYINEANPYEPRWKETFWGKENYMRLEKIKGRVDPRGLMVCNRCVGTDILYEP